MKLHPLTLKFSGESSKLEAPFLSHYYRASLPQLRVFLVLGAIFYAAFGILDTVLMPEQKYTIWFIRFIIAGPVLLGTVLASFLKSFERYMQPFLAVVLILAGGGIVCMIVIAPTPVSYYYYVGLILVFMMGYTFIHIRFLWASLYGLVIVVLYEIAAIWIRPTPFDVLLNNNFFLISANILGMLACYFIEFYTRCNYFLTQQLEIERETVNKVNQELEERVKKRTEDYQIINLALEQDIAWLKQMEEALRQSEGKYRTIIENIQEGYFEIDLAGNFTFFNDSMCRCLGYSQKELMGMNYRKYMDKENAKKLFQFFNETYTTGISGRIVEYEIIRKDGTVRQLEGFTSLQKDSSGNPIVFTGTTRDITERKQAEESIRHSEEKYRSILENIDDGYYEVDLKGNFTFFNNSMCRILRYSKEELMGMNNRQITDKENAKIVFQACNKVYNTGEPTKEFDWQIIGKDGIKRYIEQSVSLKKDSSGKPTGFRGIIHDITERKQAESQREALLESLRESEERYKALFDRSLNIIYTIDFEGRFLDANNAALNLVGYKREEIPSLNMVSLLDEDQIPLALEIVREIRETGVQKEVAELRLRDKDGIDVYVDTQGSTIISKGSPVAIQAIARDITKRKRAEQKLKESEALYRLLAEHMTDIVWMMDLDLNVTWLSPSAVKAREFSVDEILKLPLDRQLTPKSLERAVNWIGKLTRFEKDGLISEPDGILSRELEFYCKDGSTILLDCKFQFIRDEQGNATGILAEGRDITKRKQAEVSLGKSEEKYRSILENMREGYFEVDLTGNFTFLNDSVCQILGYPIDELMGMNNRYYTDKKISKKVFQAYNKVYNTEETLQEFGWQIIRKDGAERYVEGSISLQKDSSGKPIGFRGIIRDITERKRTEDKLQQTLYNLKNAVGVTIQVMVSAVEMRDPYTAGHQLRSANLACAIATEMGLSQEKVDGISMAGSIHDIGKLSIPAEILSKPTKLTDLEFSLIKEHSRIGYEMLKDVEFTWPLAQIVYQHHERMDGSGYPRNLKGEEILMEARIMAVADVVEAMASHRPYRAALGIEVALGEIEKNKGIFYDDAVADACLRLFREKGYKLIA